MQIQENLATCKAWKEVGEDFPPSPERYPFFKLAHPILVMSKTVSYYFYSRSIGLWFSATVSLTKQHRHVRTSEAFPNHPCT